MTDSSVDSACENPSGSVNVLLVEDNPGDVRLTREAFKESTLETHLHVLTDGQAAIDYLHQRQGYETAIRPDLVLLDLNLPKVHGLDVLDEIKTDEELRVLPVLILTGSSATADIEQSYRRHTNAYLQKPVDPDDFADIATAIEEFWFEWVRLPTY